ncbi:very short patch repair endonuclease [Ochrobactrum sp. EDr1-4]|uniref:very short patch repair endonuclease n=1 Tax=Ochrobactrum sp. EDr1-4 TaxID=3368622 RepID=UPI003B9F1BDD
MAAIRAANTKPELIIRKGLHASGFRYRLHAKELPGKPDLVLAKYRAVVFINGCFWHGHDCHLFHWPATREEFWHTKIGGNVARDERNLTELRSAGWRIAIIWECALKGKTRRSSGEVIDTLGQWLLTDDSELQIRGVQI